MLYGDHIDLPYTDLPYLAIIHEVYLSIENPLSINNAQFKKILKAV